ncbi:MAG: Nre family DNA repair protein [Candidatus Thorarchaeota archaeon]
MLNAEEPKVVRKFGKSIPWLAEAVKSVELASDLDISEMESINNSNNRCGICKAGKMLCGKKSCPLLTRIQSYLKIKPMYNKATLEGASPPGVFVGHFGYPNVFAGPLVPPLQGDTSQLDVPETWFGKTIEEIIDMRFKLVRGKYRINVNKPELGGRILENTKLLGLADRSVDVDLAFNSKPNSTFTLNADAQPMGPSAVMKSLEVNDNIKAERHLEKAYNDTDLKSVDAVIELYNKDIKLSSIQRAFSVGAFGLEKQRKLVPTRWSITAVDSMLSKEIMEEIKLYPTINEFRIYESTYLDNCFQIIMLPEKWNYECIEAWYPGTIWNPFDENIQMFGDWEGYHGRTNYARIGGCYYAARLAVNDLLKKERRQAGVCILREIRPGYIMPVGVWNVRENVRYALKQKPLKFSTFNEVLGHVKSKLNINLDIWKQNSHIITDTLEQKKITDFFKKIK